MAIRRAIAPKLTKLILNINVVRIRVRAGKHCNRCARASGALPRIHGVGRRRSQPTPRPGPASLSQQGIAEHALAEPALPVDDAKDARYTEDEYAA